jgi:hypothetical protein
MFRLFPSHHQGACDMIERVNNVYVFQDTVIYISVHSFDLKILKFFNEIFLILYLILTHGKR